MKTEQTGSDYQPIACASYDQYEIAIMWRRRMRLVWEENNVVFDRIVTPLDLRIVKGEEFLVLRQPEGEIVEARLDRIRCVEILES